MLRIHDTIIELIRELVPVIAAIERRDSDLRRALSSAALNVAEGAGQRGRRRESHYAIALGSARESWSCLCVADAFGYAQAAQRFKPHFDHVTGTLSVVSRR